MVASTVMGHRGIIEGYGDRRGQGDGGGEAKIKRGVSIR
jgi:hypothetical protein